jgi:hypothetical protein
VVVSATVLVSLADTVLLKGSVGDSETLAVKLGDSESDALTDAVAEPETP